MNNYQKRPTTKDFKIVALAFTLIAIAGVAIEYFKK